MHFFTKTYKAIKIVARKRMLDTSIITSQDYDEFIKVLQFRYSVFCKEMSLIKQNDTYNLLKMEFDEFDKDAYFVILKNHNEIVGSARINFGNHLPFNVKSDIGLYYPFTQLSNNIEVTKLMIRKDSRNSKSILFILNAILKFIGNKDYYYLFADVFKESITHRLLQKVGFQQLDYQYIDEYFSIDTPSLILYILKDELERVIIKEDRFSKMVF